MESGVIISSNSMDRYLGFLLLHRISRSPKELDFELDFGRINVDVAAQL